MLRDEAHAFLEAGARIEAADMVLRMLRVALPRRRGRREAHVRDGQALALLQAVGGFQAYRRAVPAPPNARPVARFLLYERAYPDSVAASVRALARGADRGRREPAHLRARCCALGRLQADLEFRSRALDGEARLAEMLGRVQAELAQVDADIAQRYFGGASPPAPRLATA